MYADVMTDSMRKAIDETNRRRSIQVAYNEAHGITPSSIIKEIHDLTERVKMAAEGEAPYAANRTAIPKDEAFRIVKELEKQMKTASQNLEFEKAALLRDQILELRRAMAEDDENVPEWERYRQFERQKR
jgi:excinuclease ABC subunit B